MFRGRAREPGRTPLPLPGAPLDCCRERRCGNPMSESLVFKPDWSEVCFRRTAFLGEAVPDFVKRPGRRSVYTSTSAPGEAEAHRLLRELSCR